MAIPEDLELTLIRTVGRCLPPLPHATAIINRLLKPFYLRKPRAPVTATAWGLRMRLKPAEAVDGGILFYPHLYNRTEFAWLRAVLRPTDVFVDIGAYIGAFSLFAACRVTRVIAIEPNPEAFSILKENIRLNNLAIEAINVAVSDQCEVLNLYFQREGNLGGSTFMHTGAESVAVVCKPLASLVDRCDVIKLDVEGMELKVLKPYLVDHRPRAIILETGRKMTPSLELCFSHGYERAGETYENTLLLARSP